MTERVGPGANVEPVPAALGRLCAGIAHQINNPLAGVLTNLEVALEAIHAASERAVSGAPDAPPGVLAEALADARDGALRIRSILRDLAVFARTDDGDVAPVELSAVAEAAIRIAWSDLRQRTTLRRDYGPAPRVDVDEARLVQVALNLLTNALHAIPEGAGDHEIRIAIRARDGEAILEVADTGVGIAPDALAHIFDPFFTTRAEAGRIGLGLAISHHLVRSWHGRIEVESTEGRGSVFRVVLPSSRAREAISAGPAIEPPVAAVRRARVLVIDDDHDVLRAVQRGLSFDHDVVALDDAARSLRMLQDGERFDLILCDLMMPRMNGIELHDALVASVPDALRSLVIVTGGAFTPRTVEFLTRVRHVEKPLTLGALRQLISAALAARG